MRTKSIYSILAAVLALTGSAVLTGCNTAEGFGEDMEDAGEAIQREAD